MRVPRPGPVAPDDRHGHAVEAVHRDRRDEDVVGGPLGSQSVRALSPAVNHPATTVQALDRIEDGLLRLAGRPLGPALLLDDTGHPGSRPPVAMGGHRLPRRRNLPAQGREPHPQIVRGGSTPCRPADRGRARGTAGLCRRASGGLGAPERRRAERPPAAPGRLRVGPAGTGRSERTRHRGRTPIVKPGPGQGV
ncbi:DUF2254 family protein [Streptomyces sp900116325]|uniref:DUF2254 family protein n=1 Tax=Streptomyces sp. 900116325 TaxID=3154295 RepID=UPI00332DD48C